jgi:hypothetical protein
MDVALITIHPRIPAQLGLRALKVGRATSGMSIAVYGYIDGEPHRSEGRSMERGVQVSFNHTATTFAGWSGGPVLNGKKVVGVHLGASPREPSPRNTALDLGAFLELLSPVRPETDPPEDRYHHSDYDMDDATWDEIGARRGMNMSKGKKKRLMPIYLNEDEAIAIEQHSSSLRARFGIAWADVQDEDEDDESYFDDELEVEKFTLIEMNPSPETTASTLPLKGYRPERATPELTRETAPPLPRSVSFKLPPASRTAATQTTPLPTNRIKNGGRIFKRENLPASEDQTLSTQSSQQAYIPPVRESPEPARTSANAKRKRKNAKRKKAKSQTTETMTTPPKEESQNFGVSLSNPDELLPAMTRGELLDLNLKLMELMSRAMAARASHASSTPTPEPQSQ